MHFFSLVAPAPYIGTRTRTRGGLHLVVAKRPTTRKKKTCTPRRNQPTVSGMALPPSGPDGPSPFSGYSDDFSGTGRIYYPIPYPTRLAPWGITDRYQYPARLTKLVITAEIENSKVFINCRVYFAFLNGTTQIGEMDLREWQKLPAVPNPPQQN